MEMATVSQGYNDFIMFQREFLSIQNSIKSVIVHENKKETIQETDVKNKAEILFVTSYPPRVCGIATYSSDLISSVKNKFSRSLAIKVCALEPAGSDYIYPEEVKYVLNTSDPEEYKKMAATINEDEAVKLVLVQHEFGLFRKQDQAFQQFLSELTKPVVIAFHTVLPYPDELLKQKVNRIAEACKSIIVMTKNSAEILAGSYGIPQQKISVIPHGTHLVPHISEQLLKSKYGLTGRKVLTTFGLLSSGKSIETTIKALPAIVAAIPEVIFLVIGKTHPEVVKEDGEKYRESLLQKVDQLSLQDHVVFINSFVTTPELLEYLQLTDIYLFTSNDPNQAVSGTFVYAASCACPIISTPIPHAKEILTDDTGMIFEFGNSTQLADSVISLLCDEDRITHLSVNTLQKMVTTAWENSAIAHAKLFEKMSDSEIAIQYDLPDINLDHLKKMTTDTGIIQFSKINQPDISTGYTLDDNARALVAMCMYYQQTGNEEVIADIQKYFNFIKYCQQPGGRFLNYVDKDLKFTEQNTTVNLDDSNGRALWALGFMISFSNHLPSQLIMEAEDVFKKSIQSIGEVFSSRAMAFAVKGIYYHNSIADNPENLELLKIFAGRLVQMYKHESSPDWQWFEGYLTYANSILPEAMLYAWLVTRENIYKNIARSSLAFLLSKTFKENGIEVISNKKWLQKGEDSGQFGEQPIDVAYTMMTLSKFYNTFHDEQYHAEMETAFNWFLGNNRLNHIIYNPCTGGCYDGLEESHVNINQGAESTISYLLARLTMQIYKNTDRPNQKKSNRTFKENNEIYYRT
jgi:glycosyltransferase involved in cell wall biosynthesis